MQTEMSWSRLHWTHRLSTIGKGHLRCGGSSNATTGVTLCSLVAASGFGSSQWSGELLPLISRWAAHTPGPGAQICRPPTGQPVALQESHFPPLAYGDGCKPYEYLTRMRITTSVGGEGGTCKLSGNLWRHWGVCNLHQTVFAELQVHVNCCSSHCLQAHHR